MFQGVLKADTALSMDMSWSRTLPVHDLEESSLLSDKRAGGRVARRVAGCKVPRPVGQPAPSFQARPACLPNQTAAGCAGGGATCMVSKVLERIAMQPFAEHGAHLAPRPFRRPGRTTEDATAGSLPPYEVIAARPYRVISCSSGKLGL